MPEDQAYLKSLRGLRVNLLFFDDARGCIMGVRDITDEFRRSARKSFRDLQRALNDKYCWKCPQRTVRSITGCRELDAWVRLREALEEEVSSFISEILGEE